MKKLILVLLIAGSTAVNAGLVCDTDYLGNTICTGTEDQDGYQSQSYENYNGWQIYNDSEGNSLQCQENYNGSMVCS